VVAIVEPSFLRLTRTPSIRPSWADDTVPLSACADAAVDVATIAPRLTPTTSQKCLFIVFSRLELAGYRMFEGCPTMAAGWLWRRAMPEARIGVRFSGERHPGYDPKIFRSRGCDKGVKRR
jgi:hypothetical protein